MYLPAVHMQTKQIKFSVYQFSGWLKSAEYSRNKNDLWGKIKKMPEWVKDTESTETWWSTFPCKIYTHSSHILDKLTGNIEGKVKNAFTWLVSLLQGLSPHTPGQRHLYLNDKNSEPWLTANTELNFKLRAWKISQQFLILPK